MHQDSSELSRYGTAEHSHAAISYQVIECGLAFTSGFCFKPWSLLWFSEVVRRRGMEQHLGYHQRREFLQQVSISLFVWSD